jgi:hypothetical protein
MTDFVRTAAGQWEDPTKWDIGAGYPDGSGDTADLASYAVSISNVDVLCGPVDCGTGILTIDTARYLQIISAGIGLTLPAAATININGTLKGPDIGGWPVVEMLGTWNMGVGAQLKRLHLWIKQTIDMSDVFGDTTEANQALCDLNVITAAGDLTIDMDIAITSIYNNAGAIHIDAGRTLKMAGGVIGLYATGTFDVNGTRANPVIIQRYVDTEPWYWQVLDTGSNNVDLDFLYTTGSKWWLGDSTNGFNFNRKPRSIVPPNRKAILDIDPILGRSAARVHHKGGNAGVAEISGLWLISDRQYERVDAIMEAGTLIGFYSDELFMPAARIVDHDYTLETGKLYTPYTIILVEDV